MEEAISISLSSSLNKEINLTFESSGYYEGSTKQATDQDGNTYFCKFSTNPRMLSCEVHGLDAIQKSNTICVPKVYCEGEYEATSFIVLEYLEFQRGSKSSWYEMGKQLAKLHKTISENEQYGFYEDNFIGETVQVNSWKSSWADFFVECRLQPQIELFEKNGYSLPNKDDLLSTVHSILSQHHPSPSLLHGDLWGGNLSFISSGPVIYDPACYYGDRETDIVMTKSFGSLPKSFYKGYEEEWPLPSDWNSRFCIYDLYHVLNHANMFGGGYEEEVIDLVHSIV